MRMTSQIFIGQGYALLELSSTPETFLWRPQESSQQTDDPDGYEGEKASEDVPHPRNVRPILRTQIGLDGVVESENDDQENGAAEPCEIVVQERLRSARRSGASQYCLFGRLINCGGIAEIMRGMPNPITAARTLTPTNTVKKAGFVCQPFAIPRLLKWEATTSGSLE